jgi:prepilin-type N-terminal cleavage/methylation domain-containing protein
MKNRHLISARRGSARAFTLAEMLISIAVLALLILVVTQVVNTTATLVRPANKHIDTDTQARTVLDRMAVDFGKMLKRTDVDYYLKAGTIRYPGHSAGHSKGGGGGGGGQTDLNDFIAFYSQVPGYSTGSPSPISLVAYRVNGLSTSASYNKLERLGKGLLWNGISNLNANNPNSLKPIFFLPILVKDIWPVVTNNNADPNGDYETIGPDVFRFEYYYLLKSGRLNDSPYDNLDADHTSIDGFKDVEAIAVTIAVIDSQSRSLLTDANILDLQDEMTDYQRQKGRGPVRTGLIEAQWYEVITDPVAHPVTATMPRAALSAIRIYNRYFDLKTL